MTLSVVEGELESLTQFLYIAPIGLVQATMDGRVVMINPMSAQLLMPLSRDGELANLFDMLGDLAPDLRQRAREFAEPYGTICDSLPLPVSAGVPGKRDAQVLSLTLLRVDTDRLMAVVSDISMTVKRDKVLRESQSWIHTILAGISDYALMSLDSQGRVHAWNESIGRVTGFGAEASVGRSCAMFYPDDTARAVRTADQLHEATRDGWSLDEGWHVRADGSRFWGSALIAPLDGMTTPLSGEPAYSLVIRDISESKDASDALRRSVSCDHLTGLANRRAFFEAAEVEVRRFDHMPRPMSMIMVDADHFKAINDTYGHAAGDAVLRCLSIHLAATCRAMDLPARVGGEEFAVLLPGTGVEGALAVASRLCEAIAAHPVEFDGAVIRYTVSAGVAAMEPGIEGVDAWLKRADAALYAAKANGRNRVERWTVTAPAVRAAHAAHPLLDKVS